MVGIHLCRTLSPRALSIYNSLGPDLVPFLCLAPCCMPAAVRRAMARAGTGSSKKRKVAKRGGVNSKAKEGTGGWKSNAIPVDLYETGAERKKRLEANLRRDHVLGRSAGCYVCGAMGHLARDCPDLPPAGGDDGGEARERAMAASRPCWRCGRTGHLGRDCPAAEADGQRSRRPALVLPPRVEVDAAEVARSDRPFHAYCALLAGTAQARSGALGGSDGGKGGNGMPLMCSPCDIRREVVEAPLLSDSHDKTKKGQEANWNGARKALYIVCER